MVFFLCKELNSVSPYFIHLYKISGGSVSLSFKNKTRLLLIDFFFFCVCSHCSSCNYLVSRTNGVCMVTTNAVQTQLNAIKDDNFRARLQYMSTNSVLQTRITKLEVSIAYSLQSH